VRSSLNNAPLQKELRVIVGALVSTDNRSTPTVT